MQFIDFTYEYDIYVSVDITKEYYFVWKAHSLCTKTIFTSIFKVLLQHCFILQCPLTSADLKRMPCGIGTVIFVYGKSKTH